MNVFTQRLKEAMNEANLKQTDIVKKTGINKGALHSYLNGKYLPKVNNLEKLSNALNVSEIWLLGNDELNDKSQLLSQIEMTIKQLEKVKTTLVELQKEYINQVEKNEELEYEIEKKKEEIQRIYEDRDENYRHIEYSSQI